MESALECRQPARSDGVASTPDAAIVDPKQKKEKTVDRSRLINKLNLINFQDGTVLVNFKHLKYDRVVSFPAKPQPCIEDTLKCHWISPKGPPEKLTAYRFQNLHIPDGPKLLCVVTDSVRVTGEGIALRLPETCMEFRARERMRHDCRGINAQLIQNSVVFSGNLLDFTATSFRVEVTAVPPQTFQWFDPESTTTVIFSNGAETYYAGECRIIRQTLGQRKRSYVLESLNRFTHRFSPKQYRSSRYQLIPSPNLIFKHPLTKKLIRLTVLDLSGSGFSVEENEQIPLLLPGMMIPEMELTFARSFKIKCRGQVLNKFVINDLVGNNSRTICGLVFLDMDSEDHSKLLALLNQAKDKNSYLSDVFDPDALWNFFFETGFIYPQKYAFIQNKKEEIRAVYEKLYTQSPSIARHFVYQEKGRILGHMSMVRYIGNSWMIHHHTANTAVHKKAGIEVLCQINHYCNDTYKIFSAHLDMVFCYFRPENKFPMKVFGGASQRMGKVKACSIDTFAYFHCQKIFNNDLDMPDPWQLVKTCCEDLIELETFYEHVSGGLMLNALGLKPDMLDHKDISEAYKSQGLKRDRYLYSLKKKDKLKAIAMVNISDIGLNLSDLTNCINFIVLDSDELSKDIFYSSISMLSTKHDQGKMPILLYPLSYADSKPIEYEKKYTLWALNLQYSDGYLKFINRLLRKY